MPRSRPRRSRPGRKPPPADRGPASGVPTGYSTRQVAETLGLPPATILSWTRRGLVTPSRTPGGAFVFSFQDLALLRTARDLLDADVPARRIRQAIEALRDGLPVGRPLSAITISAVGDRVLVEDGDGLWEPGSGQWQLDLEGRRDTPATPGASSRTPATNATSPDEFAAGASPDGGVTFASPTERPSADRPSTDLGHHAFRRHPSETADDWFDRAVDLESTSTDGAIEAYERAIGLDAAHSDAHLNLGRLLHEAGRLDEAERHYRSAAAADPHSARALYNLGVALEDRGAPTGALEAYRGAIRLDPDLAVAHFNASRLLEAAGRDSEAIQHLAEYRRLIQQGGLGA